MCILIEFCYVYWLVTVFCSHRRLWKWKLEIKSIQLDLIQWASLGNVGPAAMNILHTQQIQWKREGCIGMYLLYLPIRSSTFSSRASLIYRFSYILLHWNPNPMLFMEMKRQKERKNTVRMEFSKLINSNVHLTFRKYFICSLVIIKIYLYLFLRCLIAFP